MDWLILACLLFIAVVCGLLIIGLVMEPQLSGPDSPAIRIALADPDVETTIADNQGNYRIVNVTPGGQTGMSGFINVSDTPVIVNMSMQGRMFGPDRYIAFVNLNQSKVVAGEWYSYRGFPGSLDITLPSGASYYHLLYGPINAGLSYGEDFGVQTFWCTLDRLSPENATLYPILLDETNLSRMKDGNSYEAAVYNDTYTRKPAVLNGSYPVRPGWSVNASARRPQLFDTGSWPDFDFSRRYCIVLKNAGPDTVSMTIRM